MIVTDSQEIDILNEDYLIYRIGMGGSVEIFDIAVNSERRTGIGRAMVEKLKELFPEHTIFAFARAQNSIARDFYNALGFYPTMVPDFYHDNGGKHAILYVLPR